LKKSEISANRRESIFDAALACFNERGYYKTSMDSIAARARITKHGLYYHFKSKDQLFIELFHQRSRKYFEQINAYLTDVQDPEEKTRLFLCRGNQIIEQHSDFLRFFIEFMSIGMRKEAICREITAYYKNSINNFRAILDTWVIDAKGGTQETEKLARAVFVASIGIFFSYFCLQPDFDLVAQHNFDVERILDSIRSR